MGVLFGQDDETNLKRVSLYTVLFHNNFSLYKYTVVFGNERSICLLENKRKEKENTRKGGKKIWKSLQPPLLCFMKDWDRNPCAHVKLTLIFKMATAERREARRRKLLQNSENRLNRILGSRSSHSNTSQPQIEKDESVSQNNSVESDGVFVEREVLDSDLNGSERADKVLPLTDKTTEMEPSEGVFESKYLERKRFMDAEVRPPSALRDRDSTPQTTEQRGEGSLSKTTSNTGCWRVVLNVILAFMLVIHWFYVNLETLLSLSGKAKTESSAVKHSVQSQVRLCRGDCKMPLYHLFFG